VVRAVDHEDHTEAGVPDLFDGYLEPDRPHAGAFDEMFHRDGRVRSAYRALHSAIAPTFCLLLLPARGGSCWRRC